MENRFGFKDFVVVVLLLAIVVMLGLKMKQDDRQWSQLMSLHTKLDQQTRDITTLRRSLSEGALSISPREGGGGVIENDVFRRVREVREREDYATGDWLIDWMPSAPPKLNFMTGEDLYHRYAMYKVMESLGGTDFETLETVPYLARGWKVSPDGLSLDVELRTNVTFSDGEPMTADDVVYTWMNLLKNEEITDGQTRAFYSVVSKVEKLDSYTVRFSFEKVHYANVDRALGVPIHPKHFYKRFTDREIREHPAMLIGTGPYRLPDPLKYAPGEPVELVRNERYWGPPGPWDRIIYRVIENDSATLIAFRNGELDMFRATPEQQVDMVKDKELLRTKQNWIHDTFEAGYYYVGWNQVRGGKKTVFADKRVRQAMTMLIDRERLTSELLHGLAVVADGPFPRDGPQHSPSVEPLPYDPERAVELLLEAGFKRDAAGRMIQPDGQPFEATLLYSSGSEMVEKLALFLKDNLARGGINLKLDPQKWALMLKNLNENNFDLQISGWGGGSIEGDLDQVFHSRNIAEGDNTIAYSNPELDALLDEAKITLDEDERMKIWHKVHEIVHEDQPYTFLYSRKYLLWLDDRIKNVERLPVFGINYLYAGPAPLEWYVPKPLQERGQ